MTKCSSSIRTGAIQVRSGLQCMPSKRDLTRVITRTFFRERDGTTIMRAMRAEGFSGYEDLKLVDIPKPAASDGRVLVRITAAGVTPLEHTILSGGYSRAKAPLVLGGEGAGVVEEGGGTAFPAGSRVMFTGPYGVSENGTYSEWLAVRKENLCLIPGNIEDLSAAGVPVAYLTAQMTLSFAGFAN